MTILKIRDSDDGVTSMDVVEVPEGLSIQSGFVDSEMACCEDFVYISIIVSPEDEARLFEFLSKRRGFVPFLNNPATRN